MGLISLLTSKRSGQLSALSMLVEAAIALYKGKKDVAALYLGAAVLAYRSSVVGAIAEILIRAYQRIR
jgi:hypothetical protein